MRGGAARRRARRAKVRVAAALQHRVAVLLYHRIANPANDDFGLAVSPETFAEQLAVIEKLAHIVTLEQLVRGLAGGTLPRRAVAITFDDGYADNVLTAAPALERRGLTATFFLATGFVTSGRRFWWDRLADILLRPEQLPPRLDLVLGEERLSARLGPHTGANGGPAEAPQLHSGDPPGSSRHDLFVRLQAHLRRMTIERQEALLDELAAWTGVPESDARDGRPMTAREVSALARMPGMSVGAHSIGHRALGDLPPEEQASEIRDSKVAIEELTGSAAAHFSYPHGVLGEETAELVEAHGFEAAFTSGGAAISDGAPLYRLPRIVCEDVGGDLFRRRLRAHLFPLGSLRD